jgi:hypothetical protein
MSYLNNPNLRYNKKVAFDASGNPVEEDIADIAGTMMPSWNTGAKLDLTITQLTGGITNKLYLIKNNAIGGPDNSTLIAVF